jgi:hypothetical protein
MNLARNGSKRRSQAELAFLRERQGRRIEMRTPGNARSPLATRPDRNAIVRGGGRRPAFGRLLL